MSFAIMTAFFAHAAIKLATFQTLHKHVFTRSCWLFVEILAASSLPIASSLHVPILYTLFGMVMYIASYFIALSIYRKREF
ncbi:hypothetical protein ACWZQY_019045 [Priestia megaterium]